MGWFKLSTLDLPVYLDCLVEFYSSLLKSVLENKKEECDIDKLKFHFCGTKYMVTDERLVSLLELVPYDKVTDDIAFDMMKSRHF